MNPSNLDYVEVNCTKTLAQAAEFLSSYEWPFHSVIRPSYQTSHSMLEQEEEVSKVYLILKEGQLLGLMRALDLDDIEDGSPVVDIRVEPKSRNQGVARTALSWLTRRLFDEYENCVRIEASTRDDNRAMQSVLQKCGFELEGRLRKGWPLEGGQRRDTLLYGLLREDLEKK